MSTLQKDLMLQLRKPQTVRAYERYASEIFNVHPRINSNQYKRFEKLNRRLIAAGIFPEEYTRRLFTHLKKWIIGKGWKCMPVNMFLGEWAFNLYQSEIGDKRYYDITSDKEQEQMLVVEDVRYLMAVMEYGDDAFSIVAPFMSDAWLESCASDSHSPIRKQAQNLLQSSL